MPALRDISTDERKKAKASDFAGKNRSFPILKAGDVKAALDSIGRAGSDNYSSDELKRRILRIAKRKGFPIPKSDQKSTAAIRLPAYTIALADDDAGEGAAETWIQVLRTGKFWSPRYKDFSVTKATLATMVENFQTVTPKAPTELPLDYNHGTNRPDTVEQGKAAGWIKELALREGGTELWARVSLTPEAADLVRNEEYRFVSATFEFDHVHTDGDLRKKSIGPTLMSAALTNTPFVEGMQPVTLSKESAVSLDDESAEAEFSYDEQRRRVWAALAETYGDDGADMYGCGCYLVALYDGYAVYSERDGDTYRVDYTLGADGAVTFTSDPVEVRQVFEPLPSSDSGVTDMAKIKVKDAAGNEIELTEETVKALAKQHGQPAAADEAAMDELRASLARSETTNTELSERITKLELDKKELAAKGLVDALIRGGKVPLKKRDQYVKLAITDRKTFDELTVDLPKIYEFSTETGSSDDGEALSATQQVLSLAREEMQGNAKLTHSDAVGLVLKKNPELYNRYAKESAVRV